MAGGRKGNLTSQKMQPVCFADRNDRLIHAFMKECKNTMAVLNFCLIHGCGIRRVDVARQHIQSQGGMFYHGLFAFD